MTLAHPWALGLLVAVPFVWWWHRRMRRPATVEVPSLLFLDPETHVRPARRRAFDLELYVALASSVLLALAAAGPVLEGAPEGRTMRVVVSAGAPSASRGYEERVLRELARLRDLLGPDDHLVRIDEPAEGDGPRPTPEALVDVAQSGRAAARFILSDRTAPVGGGAGVRWISVADPEAWNVGIVTASLRPEGAGFLLFANVQHSGARARRVALRAAFGGSDGEGEGVRVLLDLPAGVSHASHAFPIPRIAPSATVRLEAENGGPLDDDLTLDDQVRWERRPVRVRYGEALSAVTRRAVERGLTAVLGRGAFVTSERDVDLVVTTTEPSEPVDGWHLILHAALEGTDAIVAAPAGFDLVRSDPLVADLSTGGVDLRFALGAEVAASGTTVLLSRRVGTRTWPVVARRGRVVHFLPDPLRGRPSPARSTLWPLFLDNLIGVASGAQDRAAWGFRRRGLLSAESSRLGRTPPAPPVAVDLAALPADRPPRTRELGRPLALGALLGLTLLWLVPWGRTRRRSGRRSARRPVVSAG